jgi:uncharacterized membrane protein YeaQ/YmgE (transglycosylase-associated protein family)
LPKPSVEYSRPRKAPGARALEAGKARPVGRVLWNFSPIVRVVHDAFTLGESAMNLSNESLIVIILVGIVAGWLAGRIVDGGGFGLIGDLIVGIIGAFIGDWLVPRLGIHLGVGTLALVVNATLGAIVLLLILRIVAGNRGWGGGWGTGWGGRWGRRW